MITRRSNSGSMATLAFVGLVPLMFAIGAFAVDMMHYNSTKGELQRSCDAAALAGASQLYQYDVDKGASAINNAKAVLNSNVTDGRWVDSSNTNPDIVTNVTISKIPNFKVNPPVMGEVKVDGMMRIRGLFSKIFDNYTQDVATFAIASPTGKVNQAAPNNLYPLALGLNTPGPDGTLLKDKTVGMPITLVFATPDNAGWTTFNLGGGGGQVKNIILSYKKGTGAPVTTPPIKIGDSIDLKNGVMGSVLGEIDAAVDAANASGGQLTVVVPVVNTSSFNSSATVVGFVGLTIVGVDAASSPKRLNGIISNSTLNGTWDGSATYDASAPGASTFFSNITVSPPRLIQ